MNKKRKKLFYWGISALALLLLFSIKFNTQIYILVEDGYEVFLDKEIDLGPGNGEPIPIRDKVEELNIKPFEDIAVLFILDNEILYVTDSLPPSFMGLNYVLIEKPLRMGFHSIDVSTSTTGAELKKTVFILFNHYIKIDYWEGRDKFTVRTGFNPFLFM